MLKLKFHTENQFNKFVSTYINPKRKPLATMEKHSSANLWLQSRTPATSHSNALNKNYPSKDTLSFKN